MTEKRFEDMGNDEIIQENHKIMAKTEKLIKAIYVVLGVTIVGYIVLILLKLGVI